MRRLIMIMIMIKIMIKSVLVASHTNKANCALQQSIGNVCNVGIENNIKVNQKKHDETDVT